MDNAIEQPFLVTQSSYIILYIRHFMAVLPHAYIYPSQVHISEQFISILAIRMLKVDS